MRLALASLVVAVVGVACDGKEGEANTPGSSPSSAGTVTVKMVDADAGPAASPAAVASGGGRTGARPPAATSSDAGAGSDADFPVSTMDPIAPARGDRIDIPITVISDGSQPPVVLVDVSIGGQPPFQAIVDSGSTGLRVVTGTIPDSAWQVSATPAHVEVFPGNGNVINGSLATAMVQLGGVSVPTAVTVMDITSATCTSDRPNCDGSAPIAQFRFRNEYPAVMGVGMRVLDVPSPLAAMAATGKYIMSLPHFGGIAQGVMTLDPTADDIGRFLPASSFPATGKSQVPGIPGWNDTQTPFCLNAFCSVGLFDTGEGSPQIVVTNTGVSGDDDSRLGVPEGSTEIPVGTRVVAEFGGNAGYGFTVQDPPTVGHDLFRLVDSSKSMNLSIMPFFEKDVLYDYQGGSVTFTHKVD